MKHIFTYLLVVSIGANIYFFVYFMSLKKEADKKMKLDFWKDISYKEGYEFLEGKMKIDFPETDFKQKPCLVYFWNSTMYDSKGATAMRELDSLATDLGEYSFNYIFATEMDEIEAKDFLTRRGVKFKSFKVLGGMDNFISGVYNEKPPKYKQIFSSKHHDSDCPDPRKAKVWGYYLLMDNKGQILYNNFKFRTPIQDSSLMRRLKSFPHVTNLKY